MQHAACPPPIVQTSNQRHSCQIMQLGYHVSQHPQSLSFDPHQTPLRCGPRAQVFSLWSYLWLSLRPALGRSQHKYNRPGPKLSWMLSLLSTKPSSGLGICSIYSWSLLWIHDGLLSNAVWENLLISRHKWQNAEAKRCLDEPHSLEHETETSRKRKGEKEK